MRKLHRCISFHQPTTYVDKGTIRTRHRIRFFAAGQLEDAVGPTKYLATRMAYKRIAQLQSHSPIEPYFTDPITGDQLLGKARPKKPLLNRARAA